MVLSISYGGGTMPVLVKPFSINTMESPAQLQEAMRVMNLDIPMVEDYSVFRRPVTVGENRLPNSLAVNPMEGSDAGINGAPGEPTFRRYETYARSGAGTIWFEACAFMPDGRGGPNQLYINGASVKEFARLTARVDELCRQKFGYKPYKILQLSHAGRASHDLEGSAKPLTVCENPWLDPYYPGVEVVSDGYIEHVEEELVKAACLAKEAGFDAVDLKMCHDFLLREFLSAFTRQGKYGGSFENRTRFYFSCIDKIRERLKGTLDIAVRINAYDSIPYPYGWGMLQENGIMREDLDEPIRLIRLLVKRGIHMFSISTMTPRFAPRNHGYVANFKPDAKVNPYEGASALLEATRRIKRMVPEAILISAGLSLFEKYAMQVGAGGIKEGWFDIAGYGRQVLADPHFIECALSGIQARPEAACRVCDSCFQCLGLGWPAGCAVHDPLYRAILKIANTMEKTG